MDLPVRDKFADLTHVNEVYAQKLLAQSGNDVTGAVATFAQSLEKLPLKAWRVESDPEEKWEEKAEMRKKRVRVNRVNEICLEVYSRVFEVRDTGRRHGRELEESACWETLWSHKWNVATAIRKLDIKFQMEPLLVEADFGEREFKKAALLNEDRGYLGRAGDEPFQLAAELVRLVPDSVDRSPAKLVEIENRDGETERVIVQDCVRTFAGEDHRQRLERFLNGAFQEFGNYSQGMAHVAALLLLTLKEDDVIVILRKINTDIIPGHWKHESDGFGTNAYVFQRVVENNHPEFNKHFLDSSLNLLPEMYTRKWFCGLGLHCLDVEHVYRFLKNLLSRGFEYLMSFGVAVLVHFRERLLELDGIGGLLEVLMLSEKAGVTAEDQVAILDKADATDFSSDLGNAEELEELRKKLYETHLRERMEKAAACAKEAEEDEGDMCTVCDSAPIRWVDEDDDGAPICDDCKLKVEALGHEVTEW